MRQISWRIEGQCATCFEWRIGGAGWRAFSRSARKHWVHSGATLARAWRDGPMRHSLSPVRGRVAHGAMQKRIGFILCTRLNDCRRAAAFGILKYIGICS